MPTHENKVYGIPALKAMADYGRSKGIIVSVETRGAGGGAGRGQRRGRTALLARAPSAVRQRAVLRRPVQRLRLRRLRASASRGTARSRHAAA